MLLRCESLEPPMSQLGQYRPVDDVLGMSASPPTPEVLLHSANRRDVPSLELRRDDVPYTHTLC